GASWKNCALTSSLFLEIHKVFLRKTAIARTQFFSGFALAELCGIALIRLKTRFSIEDSRLSHAAVRDTPRLVGARVRFAHLRCD
ncbi:MAG: hypothetical protein IJQ36_09640, partial [Oscillospiraceae bacterium]|nr:hypothetical protein [Oscillospiraceae bacterium]